MARQYVIMSYNYTPVNPRGAHPAPRIGRREAAVAQDAREPIVGTWTLNLEKSTYATRKPPRSTIRTFDYTRDGLILVTLQTENAQGARSSNHWYMGFDGKEYPEFSRERGATPILWIRIDHVDAHTKELIGRRLEGGLMTIVDLFTFKVSPDGRFLSVIYKTPDGKPTGDVVVFDRQS